MDLVAGQSTSFPADATHVPTFYVPTFYVPTYVPTYFPTLVPTPYLFMLSELYLNVRRSPHLLLLLVLGTIFGGIHCAGWYLPFPTYAKQELWRVASVTITIYPIGASTIAAAALIVVLFVVLIVVVVILLIVVIFSLILSLILGRIDLISLQTLDRVSLCLHLPAIFKFYSDHRQKIFAIYMTIYVFTYISARLLLLGLALALLRHQPPNVFITVDWTRFYPHIF